MINFRNIDQQKRSVIRGLIFLSTVLIIASNVDWRLPSLFCVSRVSLNFKIDSLSDTVDIVLATVERTEGTRVQLWFIILKIELTPRLGIGY